MIRRQCLNGHPRTQIRTANANIDDALNRLSCVSGVRTASDRLGEGKATLTLFHDIRNNRLPVDLKNV